MFWRYIDDNNVGYWQKNVVFPKGLQ